MAKEEKKTIRNKENDGNCQKKKREETARNGKFIIAFEVQEFFLV